MSLAFNDVPTPSVECPHPWMDRAAARRYYPAHRGGRRRQLPIIGKIGESGMGAVYVAEHALLGRRAAIKVLPREMSHRQDW